jgi:hypothetical protein
MRSSGLPPNEALQQTGPASRLFEIRSLCSRPRC